MHMVARKVSIHPLAIPLRSRVRHAASDRSAADPIVCGIELSDGTIGYGETLPRTYVTGETPDSVIEAVRSVFAPHLLEFRAKSFPTALEFIETLPWGDTQNRALPAARAAVELALLDAAMRAFHRGTDDVVQWMGLGGFGKPGSMQRIRYGGVLAGDESDSVRRRLRWMYWGGLRDFKFKVGLPRDHERLRAAARYLARPMAQGRATLRADANGAWSLSEALQWLDAAREVPLSAIEQPLARGAESDLVELKTRFRVPIVHDESLVTEDDGHRLIETGVADVFNVRISKCGGFMPSLRIAALARKHGVRLQLGCMVGETSLLSAVGLRFLEVCPQVEWAEGCFGSYLLRGDIVRGGLRFGRGGRPPVLEDEGWGVHVEEGRLKGWACGEQLEFPL